MKAALPRVLNALENDRRGSMLPYSVIPLLGEAARTLKAGFAPWINFALRAFSEACIDVVGSFLWFGEVPAMALDDDGG